MEPAGFLLVGGASRRMGQDKAFLAFGGKPLLHHMADKVASVAGSCRLLGSPERYGGLGWPVHPDLVPGCGPLGGVHAAVALALAEWSLIVACDLPMLPAGFLRGLVEAGRRSQADAVVAADPSGAVQPLCALYRRSSLPVLERCLAGGVHRMRSVVAQLQADVVPAGDPAWLANLNTPEEWSRHVASTSP